MPLGHTRNETTSLQYCDIIQLCNNGPGVGSTIEVWLPFSACQRDDQSISFPYSFFLSRLLSNYLFLWLFFFLRMDELRPQSFHDLCSGQVKAATCLGKETPGRIGIQPLYRPPCCPREWRLLLAPEHSSNVHQETTETFSYFVIKPMMKWGVAGE